MSFPKLIFLTFLVTATASLRAEPLTLADALARTLERSPELAAYNWDIRAAEARRIQAGLRPNPELSLDLENVSGSGDYRNGDAMEQTLQLGQLIELGGKRSARLTEAQAGIDVATWEYQVKRVEVLKTTTQAFVDTLVAERQVALAKETAALARGVTPLTQKRLEAGKANAVEVTRSHIAVASAQIELEQAQRKVIAARSRLAAQFGERTARFGPTIGNLERLDALPDFQTLAARLATHPQLARWTAERERREAVLLGASAQGRPDLTLLAGPRVIGKADDVTFVVGASIPLPFFNRNQGAIAEAKANLAKIREEKAAAETRAYADLTAAYQTLLGARRETELLQKDVLPGASEAEKQMTDGYVAGRFTQLEILDARRTLVEARRQNLRALADYHIALAEIEALTARPVALFSTTSKTISNSK